MYQRGNTELSIAILGGGESGVGAARLAKTMGHNAFLSDSGKIKPGYRRQLIEQDVPFEEGEHTLSTFFEADVIVKSPGIPNEVPIIQELRKAGKSVISEVEYAYRCTDARLIAITGSNGKTTTTALTHALLQAGGMDVGLGGNIGTSFAGLVASTHHEYYVVELSSFQLDDIQHFRSEVALLLNITADHLDRYAYQLERYAAAKFAIGRNQRPEDMFIYRSDDPVTAQEMPRHPLPARHCPFSFGADAQSHGYVEGDELVLKGYGRFSLAEMTLMGRHNALNAIAALLVARHYELDPEVLKPTLRDFSPVEHRLEKVARIDGVWYVNDSKATNVDSVWYALESMTRPTVWIVGGIDKGNDYRMLEGLVREKVKHVIVLGENKDKFHQCFGYKPFTQVMTMKEAVATAAGVAEGGDYVLLSPACSSFDLFENYAQRGRIFKEEVNQLIAPS